MITINLFLSSIYGFYIIALIIFISFKLVTPPGVPTPYKGISLKSFKRHIFQCSTDWKDVKKSTIANIFISNLHHPIAYKYILLHIYINHTYKFYNVSSHLNILLDMQRWRFFTHPTILYPRHGYDDATERTKFTLFG